MPDLLFNCLFAPPLPSRLSKQIKLIFTQRLLSKFQIPSVPRKGLCIMCGRPAYNLLPSELKRVLLKKNNMSQKGSGKTSVSVKLNFVFRHCLTTTNKS